METHNAGFLTKQKSTAQRTNEKRKRKKKRGCGENKRGVNVVCFRLKSVRILIYHVTNVFGIIICYTLFGECFLVSHTPLNGSSFNE